MSLLEKWMAWTKKHADNARVPLFSENNLVVETFEHRGLRKLKRHPVFDGRMINVVENGLDKENWLGIVYIMHWLNDDVTVPLYIGKAERRGVRHDLSANLKGIRKNMHMFGRWGYGLAYHVGDLSHALFGGTAYRNPTRKYRRWVERIFSRSEPPTLHRKVYVSLIGWEDGMKGPSGLEGSVPAVEKELIALASVLFPNALMNIDGT